MITSEWFTPTRATGLVAYGTAVTCCAIAWVRKKGRHGSSQLVASLTLIESALLVDMAFNLRWMLHALVGDFAQRHHEYEVRRVPQLIALTILAGLLLLGLGGISRLFRGRIGALLAVSGVLLALVSWSTEVVSLHAVDHVLYQPLGDLFPPLGSLMAVTIIWILASLMTSMGILIDSLQARSDHG
jgi:hypothetical protein